MPGLYGGVYNCALLRLGKLNSRTYLSDSWFDFFHIRLLLIYFIVKDCCPIKSGTIFTRYEIHLGRYNSSPRWVFVLEAE